MGHRANFVLIRDGRGAAYSDQWAALGSTYAFAGGPADATAATQAAEPTAELLDWAFAEAGYLLDFDERMAIVFGHPEPIDLEELAEFGGQELGAANELDAALERGPLEFLKAIAPRWTGWQLRWDERGVDAFAAHLTRRGIGSIITQPTKHPAGCVTETLQA
jgi:hypothetical protein